MQRTVQRIFFFGKAKAHDALVETVHIKSGQGNRGHADFDGEPAAKFGFAQRAHTTDLHALEKAAFAGQQAKAGLRQASAEQIAFALVEAGSPR